MHQLKKLMSTEARRELRKNLSDDAAIVYSDYSKGKSDYGHDAFIKNNIFRTLPIES